MNAFYCVVDKHAKTKCIMETDDRTSIAAVEKRCAEISGRPRDDFRVIFVGCAEHFSEFGKSPENLFPNKYRAFKTVPSVEAVK